MGNNSTLRFVNPELSALCARLIKSVPKQCFSNSRRALFKIPEIKKALYCEGYGSIYENSGVFTEHAWLELRDEIIDVAWISGMKHVEGERLIGYYSAAKKWNLAEIQQHPKRRTRDSYYRLHDYYRTDTDKKEYADIMTALVIMQLENGYPIKDFLQMHVPARLRHKLRNRKPTDLKT